MKFFVASLWVLLCGCSSIFPQGSGFFSVGLEKTQQLKNFYNIDDEGPFYVFISSVNNLDMLTGTPLERIRDKVADEILKGHICKSGYTLLEDTLMYPGETGGVSIYLHCTNN